MGFTHIIIVPSSIDSSMVIGMNCYMSGARLIGFSFAGLTRSSELICVSARDDVAPPSR